MENISADNKVVSAALNTATKDVAVIAIQVIGFKFPNKLMEEHFNENYMETEKFPTSSFKGKTIDVIDFQKSGTWSQHQRYIGNARNKTEKNDKQSFKLGLIKLW